MKAIAKQIRMSPRKIRLVVDAVRGLSIEEALIVLSSMQKRAAMPVIKAIESAVANAAVSGRESSNLVISSITVNEGVMMKRFHPSSRGRVHPYKKRASHLSVVLKEKAVKVVSVAKTEIQTEDKKKGAEEIKDQKSKIKNTDKK
jgi:large subunit ribosomal protein L22